MDEGQGIDLRVYSGTTTIECSCLDSTGIVTAPGANLVYEGQQVWSDPQFCAPADCIEFEEGDYRLDVNSPCTAWRSPCGETIGGLEVGCGVEQLGACCIGEQCVLAPPWECEGLGGTYKGDGTACDPNPCVATPYDPMSWGKLKWQFRGRKAAPGPGSR